MKLIILLYHKLIFLIVVYQRVRFLPLDVFIVDDGVDGREEDEVTLAIKNENFAKSFI